MSSNARTPNHDEGLSAQSTITGKQEYLTSTNHILNTGGGGGSATVVGIGPVGQNNVAYDTISYANTSATVDTYSYFSGGVAGALTATVTITYTDTTKNQVSTVVRT